MVGKVLICDDSMLVRKKLRTLVEEFGLAVVEAQNGQQAVAHYAKELPDLVLMDIVMPELTGIEALEKIKAFDPAAVVVMISSTGTSTKLIAALKQGAADFVQKPFDPEQIKQLLERLLAQKKGAGHV